MRGLTPQARVERGFTLVEVTLVMAISGILLGTLAISIYQFSHLTRLHRDSLSAGAQVQLVGTTLNRDVISAASGRVTVDGDDTALSLHILRIPEASFGEPTPPAPQWITYTYTAGADNSGVLLRNESGAERVVARNIEALSFGPSGTISVEVPITFTVVVGDQRQEGVFLFHPRPLK